MSALIMFRSLTYAQRGSRILERAGITATITKAPQGTTDQGCSYCIRLTEARLRSALKILDDAGIRHGRILRGGVGGDWQEVFL